MRIGIDVDGVLSDFYTAYEKLHIFVSGEDRFGDKKFPAQYPQSWDWVNDHFGYSKEITKKVWGIIKTDPDFWFNLGLLPDALSLVLEPSDDVYFISDRIGVLAKRQTEQWLEHKLGINLKGCRSAHVGQNFRIIFVICEECRREPVCEYCFCEGLSDQTVVLLTVGPHDKAYQMK